MDGVNKITITMDGDNLITMMDGGITIQITDGDNQTIIIMDGVNKAIITMDGDNLIIMVDGGIIIQITDGGNQIIYGNIINKYTETIFKVKIGWIYKRKDNNKDNLVNLI